MLLTHLAFFSFLGGAGLRTAGINTSLLVMMRKNGSVGPSALFQVIEPDAEVTLGFDAGITFDGTDETLISAVITCDLWDYSPQEDFTPAARLLSAPRIVPSNASGVANCQVNVILGDMVPGAIYVIRAKLRSSDSQLFVPLCQLRCLEIG